MRAHIFDMDGTLLIGTSAPLLLAEALGQPDALGDLEERFAGGNATAVDFARALHAMWGVVSEETIDRAFAAAPLIGGIEDVLTDIHERGERACMITMSPAYFAERMLGLGFDAVYASPFPKSADEPLDEAGILEPADKPRLAALFCEEHGTTMGEAVAYGDSMSDVPLFEQVGTRIAVNGDHHLEGRADAAVRGDDLRAAVRAARELLG